MRLFVAVDPGERFRSELSRRLDAWRPRLRVAWVRPEHLHVTLRFLGELPEAVLPAMTAALHEAAAGRGPLLLRPGEPGAFPGPRDPRVLFLHLASGGELERLADAVRKAVDPLLPPAQRDDKPFRAHLTLARIKRPLAAAERRALDELSLGAWEPLAVSELLLVRSELGSDGPRYTTLAAAALPSGG